MLALELREPTPDAREGDVGRRVREGLAPPRVRPLRQRDPAPAAADRDRTRSWSAGSPCWRRHLATLAPTAPETGRRRSLRAVRLSGIRRVYGEVVAVDGVDLDIARGEFFTLLGPSGSGKTTTLRVIAGFERPDARPRRAAGHRRHARAPPRARRQHRLPGLRALPAHDGAGERRVRAAGQADVARPERRAQAERGARARPAARARRAQAGQLSGGQRQRVALARAIVNRPPVAPPRRAARRARPEAAPGDADRAQAAAARARHHVRLRHARPGGGAHDERPARRLQRGPDRAGRLARRRSTSTRDRVRRGLRRHLERPRARRAGASPSGPEKIRHDADERGGRARRATIADVVYLGLVTPLRRRARRRAASSTSSAEPRDVHRRTGARGARQARLALRGGRTHSSRSTRREREENSLRAR